MSGYFVTGTDTDVGKTFASAALIHALVASGRRVVGMKPVASGCTEDTGRRRNADADQLLAAGNVDAEYDLVCPYRFLPPIAPHIAASMEACEIDPAHIVSCYQRLAGQADRVVVEGVGGWCVPIGPELSMADVAVELGLPVILVIGARLGCINHALLTHEAIAMRGLTLAGWVYNRIDPRMDAADAVRESLRDRLPAPLLAELPHRSAAGPRGLAGHFQLP